MNLMMFGTRMFEIQTFYFKVKMRLSNYLCFWVFLLVNITEREVLFLPKQDVYGSGEGCSNMGAVQNVLN